MKRFLVAALAASAVFGANAFAYDNCDDEGGRYDRYERQSVRREIIYEQPVVVYQAPPPRVVRERIVYRERPRIHDERDVRYYEEPRPYRRYEEPARVYRYEEARPYRSHDEYQDRYPRHDGNRAIGQLVGAVAGGVIGNQIGRGGGRVAATAIGAVLGGVVGGNVADAY